MVTYQKLKHVVGDKLLVEAVCLSTDTKPTENIADSSKLTEQDTGKKYLFNGGTWYNVTEELPIEIEEPTLITLTQDTDIIDLATKAYNGEVLVQMYTDEVQEDTHTPPPILMPCSPLVASPMATSEPEPIIFGFVISYVYAVWSSTGEALAPNMLPAALGCVLSSTPTTHITKDDAVVCGILADRSDSSFTYYSIEAFSEHYFVPKFLITPLYSKQQQTHSAAPVMLIRNNYLVTFYDGKTDVLLNQFLIDAGMSIGSTEIPEGYDYWTKVSEPTEDSMHYSYEDITNMSADGDLTFYGWGGFNVSYYDGLTGNLISTEQVDSGSMPSNVPHPEWYWFDVVNPDDPSLPTSIVNVDPTNVQIYDDTSYWGWETDPREQQGGE